MIITIIRDFLDFSFRVVYIYDCVRFWTQCAVLAQSVARRLGKAEVGGSSPLDSFEPFPGSARKCGAFGVFLLWKFQSVGILQTFLWTYRLERKKQFLVEDSFTCHKICYTEVN